MRGNALLLHGFGAGMDQLAGVSAGDWLAAASHAWADITARHPNSVLIGYSMGAALALRQPSPSPNRGSSSLEPRPTSTWTRQLATRIAAPIQAFCLVDKGGTDP